ncbi:ankyrin-3-like [Physella acuta]|uniref:ankyrin-3-like n=1 Tax=Physella acuta TaxID=109671 RepID=UPI0027DD8550|nr:ankyrin-3-like [Physella acuta]
MINSPEMDIDEQIWEGETMLLNAVQSNEIDMVKYLLEKRVNIHHVDRKGNTALHFAYGGKSEIITLFLAAGAKVDVKNSENQTPLHVAANKSDTEMINILVEAKADINCLDNRGQTPLAICVENSDLNTATCLLRHGAEVNKGNNHGVTPLIRAVTKQDEKLVDILIVHKADVNFTDHKQTTALIYALMNVNKHIVSKLIQAGADVNKKTTWRYRDANRIKYDLLEEVKNTLLDTSEHNLTPLHIAAQTFPQHPAHKSVEVVNVLLKGGANVHAVDEDDRTPLHISAIYGDLDIVNSLIKAGSNINVTDKFGNTALLMSLLYNNKEVSKYCIESGADVNLICESQCSPLYVAVLYNNTELVQMLIQKGALLDKGRKSEFLMALKHIYINLSILLLENGVNANVKDDTQTPALIIGLQLSKFNKTSKSSLGDIERSEQLFTRKRKRLYCLDPNETTVPTTVPTKVFVSNKQSIKTKALIESMLQHGANVSLADIEGNTCLHEAARYCSKEILELLLHYKAEVNQQNVNGETPLMIACVSGNVEAAEILLKAGANVFLVDKNKNTALHHCAQNRTELLPLVEKLVLHSNQNNDEFRQENTLVSNANQTVRAQESDLFVNMTNDNKESAIHIACKLGLLNIVNFLIGQKCNLDCITCAGQTPLMIALKHQFIDVVKSLIENNANVNIRDNDGETVLHAAVKRDENYLQDRTRQTALHCESKSSNYSIISALLELGANPDISTNEGITALMIAANKGNIPVVKLLVHNGANVNMQDCEGRNACMYAVMVVKNTTDSYLGTYRDFHYNHRDLFRSHLNVFRKTADIFEIINVLVTAGADLNILDNENRSIIVYTLLNVERNSQKECIQRFLRLGVNLILHENHRYLLNKFMLTYSTRDFGEICNTVLKEDFKICFQFLLINGITLKHSRNYYTQCPESNFRWVFRNKNFDFLRFFLATGFIFTSDLKSLRYDKYFKDDVDEYLEYNDSLHAELTLAKIEPWPLVKLAFIEVSTLLGTGPMREEKLKQTKLPPRLQRTLMFQEPISRLPVKDWSRIPLCFDPVQYETLPCPRPLLYYWPVGHRLVN